MDKHAKQKLSVMLAAALAVSPFMAAPKAYALDDLKIKAHDTDEDTWTYYTITFTVDEDLEEGDWIEIRFADDFDLSDVDEDDDVEVNGELPDKGGVKIDDNVIRIYLNDDIADAIEDDDNEVEVYIDNVYNPEDDGEYKIEVRTSQEKSWVSKKISIGDDDDDDDDGEFSVDLGTSEAGEETSIELYGIRLDDDDELETGKWITVVFPNKNMLPKSIKKSDVEINGKNPTDVKISGSEVQLKIPSSLDGEYKFDIYFDEDAGIKNPKDPDDDYVFKVKYNGTTYVSEPFEVVDPDAKTTDYAVTLSDYRAGARSSYSFEVNLGSKRLGSNQTITVEFPTSSMVPSTMSNTAVTINGYTARSVSVSGNRVTITTPSSFSGTTKPRFNFTWDAYLTNPQTAGSYTLSVTFSGKTYRSKSFSIIGNYVVTPTPVDNSTATLTLTKSAVNVTTGINVGIKGVGVPLEKNADFIELALPAGFRVPAVVNTGAITVNGIVPGYVVSRGQNLVIYPAQDIQSNTPVTVLIGESAGIQTPAAYGSYNIGVYTSEERDALFTRTVTIMPANAAILKVNVGSYTMNGQTRPLPAAPYVVNGNTLVPASFFKDALGLTVSYNNSQATIISGNTSIKFTVGSNQATVNNTKMNLPVAVQLKNNVPMVPIRFVSDTLKLKLGWDGTTSSVYIAK